MNKLVTDILGFSIIILFSATLISGFKYDTNPTLRNAIDIFLSAIFMTIGFLVLLKELSLI